MELAVELVIASDLESADLPMAFQKQSADMHQIISDRLSIGEVRALIDQAHRRAINESQHTFVIVSKSLASEAQNALLKLFEEPPADTQLYLIIPHESVLLPTLRSRFVRTSSGSPAAVRDDVSLFLTASYPERLELIADRVKKKDTVWMNAVVLAVAETLTPDTIMNEPGLTHSLSLVESYLNINGSSKKMLLEELALSVPLTR